MYSDVCPFCCDDLNECEECGGCQECGSCYCEDEDYEEDYGDLND